MTATIDMNYSQVLDIVMQMPFDQKKKLSEELAAYCNASTFTTHQSYTAEELKSRIAEAEEDIRCGRVFAAEEMHRKMEEKFPWLCD